MTVHEEFLQILRVLRHSPKRTRQVKAFPIRSRQTRNRLTINGGEHHECTQ
jgi:hypothetical protein